MYCSGHFYDACKFSILHLHTSCCPECWCRSACYLYVLQLRNCSLCVFTIRYMFFKSFLNFLQVIIFSFVYMTVRKYLVIISRVVLGFFVKSCTRVSGKSCRFLLIFLMFIIEELQPLLCVIYFIIEISLLAPLDPQGWWVLIDCYLVWICVVWGFMFCVVGLSFVCRWFIQWCCC